MKRLVTGCMLAVIGLTAVNATAQEPLRAPAYALQTQPPPAPTIADPQAPPVAQAPPAAAVPYAGPAAHPAPLYQNVRVKDRRKIHPCAVPTIVEVPDPCNPCCTVCIEICAPPCECLCVRQGGLLGRKTIFDYGKYSIDVKSRRGRIVVDYDA